MFISDSELLVLGRRYQQLAAEEDWEALKLNFAHIGNNSFIPAPRRIMGAKFISIGDNFVTLSNTRIEAVIEYGGKQYSPRITIGNNVTLNTDCHIGCTHSITIGNNVLIASRVYISDHAHGNLDASDIGIGPHLRPLSSKGPVIIGDNVWIGNGVCVMPGVTIGANSVIGANTVVTKNVPPNAIFVGSPGRVLRLLNDPR